MKNKKLGFTLMEIVLATRIIGIVLAPMPKLVSKILGYQANESLQNLSDINEMFTEIERDFMFVSGIGNINYTGLPNNLIITKADGCVISFDYNSTANTFTKTITTTPPSTNCGRMLIVDNLHTDFTFEKETSLPVFNLRIRKNWDTNNMRPQFIKIRPFL